MWCKNCGREYGDIETCPDCGETGIAMPSASWGSGLSDNFLAKWPRDDSGELVSPRYLFNRSSIDMADEMTINFLSAYGIPALRMYPNDGRFGRLMIGMAGTGTDIYVPETMYEEAIALVEGECLV